ncbi:putative ribonuclease H-like domain-containing protein [Tanacetum coccineum]
MNIYNMKLEQFQVNTKFLNTLPPEWSKFVIDIKLVWDLYTTNIDQLHAYLGQHEFHANEGDKHLLVVGYYKDITLLGASGSNSKKQRTVICYNYKGEGHMSKQCTKTKKKLDDSWFKDKVLLVQAQASGQILHEEELAFLADPGILEEQVKVLKEGQNVDLRSNDTVSDLGARSVEIDRLKQTLSEHLKEKESLMKTVTLLKNDFKKEKSRNIDREIALEKKIKQLDNIEIFQRDNSVSNQSAPSFDQLFELNELKAQSQEKDTVIKKLKERIKALSGKKNEDKIKQELEEIETINIELDHRVTKLIAENEHLKQTYKQLYDSIKPARIRSKEQCDDLINQVNIKSVEISDLNARLQEKVLVITALKNDLRKLKGKDLADNAVTKHTIDPEMLKIDVEYLNPRLLNNRSVHSNYIKHTQEEAATLREIVEQGKSQNPLNTSLDSACKYTKQIQELLVLIGQTCPRFNNSSEKLVAVTPKNKDKRVRFTEPVTSSGYTINKTAYTSNIVSNKPLLSSTRVQRKLKFGNTKKDKIQQTPSSTQKNTVEAHPRKVKSSLKNKDCVVEPKGTAHVQNSKLNANSELKCVKAVEEENGKQRTVIYYNCKREGHMSKQCTKPKTKRDDSWFKDKVLLVQAQANGQILHEEELTFLADPGILEDGSDALAEVHNHDNVNNNMINQAVQAMQSSEQSNVVNHSETEITNFETRFVPQTDLSAKQAFWAQNSLNSPDLTLSSRPTKVEVPKELPKVNMVNTSLKKLKHHLVGFDVVVKERTTATAITKGS